MIGSNPPAGGDGAVAAYEELRSHILMGAPGSRHFGLILLVREGIAAWIERCASASTPAARSATPHHASGMLPPSEQLRADIACILAGIALTTRGETRL